MYKPFLIVLDIRITLKNKMKMIMKLKKKTLLSKANYLIEKKNFMIKGMRD